MRGIRGWCGWIIRRGRNVTVGQGISYEGLCFVRCFIRVIWSVG